MSCEGSRVPRDGAFLGVEEHLRTGQFLESRGLAFLLRSLVNAPRVRKTSVLQEKGSGVQI